MHSSLPVGAKFECVTSSSASASLAIAKCMSKLQDKPMIQSKNAVPSEAKRCLLVEDTISCGTSALDEAKVPVSDMCVFIDRQQGGRAKLEQLGVRVHAVFTIETVLQVLHRHRRIEVATVQKVSEHLQNFNTAPSALNAA
jgi:uridine monophosphate synthetase